MKRAEAARLRLGAARLAGVSAPAFSDAVRRALLVAGWSPERRFDTAIIRDAHTKCGLTFHAEAERFVSSFGGLSLLGARGELLADFDPLGALVRLSVEQMRETETWMGESFAVLGLVRAQHQLLLMSERGALYAAGEHVLVCYGTDFGELFERLCATNVAGSALN